MNFVNGVNRVLRHAGIIAGDDDDLNAFSDTQHANFSRKAQIAIQDELAELFADKVFPYEQTQAFITLSSGTRTYSLDTNFVRFLDKNPFLLEVSAATTTGTSQNRKIIEYPGGEEKLRLDILDYRDTSAYPAWFYRIGGTTNQIGFYPVLDSSADSDIYRYEFERTRTVTNASDTIPIISTEGVNAFLESAARRFDYMRLTPQEKAAFFPGGLNSDPQIQQARARLLEYARITHPSEMYGRRYG